MIEAVKKHGWDGDWFLRAYDFYGKKVGSNENEEGKIFIESQGWCSMAEIGKEEGLVEKSLDAVKEHLDCEYGIVLNNPAFTKYILNMVKFLPTLLVIKKMEVYFVIIILG